MKSLKNQIKAIDKPIDIKVAMSLSCTMCPEVVMGTQKIAAEKQFSNGTRFRYPTFSKVKAKIQYNECGHV